MIRKVLPATVTAALAVFAFPLAAHAGSGAKTTCSESFAKWHFLSTEQPVGGYVTVDIGRNGVDYTTDVWNQTTFVSIGGPFEGSTLLVQWHTADGAVIKEKGKGVAVAMGSCTVVSTTTPEPPTTIDVTTTVPITTVPPTTPATTVPVETVPVTVVPSTDGPTTTLPPSRPQRVTNDRSVDSTSPVSPATTTGFLLPATGPQQAAGTAVLGALTLALGSMLLAVSRRRTV